MSELNLTVVFLLIYIFILHFLICFFFCLFLILSASVDLIKSFVTPFVLFSIGNQTLYLYAFCRHPKISTDFTYTELYVWLTNTKLGNHRDHFLSLHIKKLTCFNLFPTFILPSFIIVI